MSRRKEEVTEIGQSSKDQEPVLLNERTVHTLHPSATENFGSLTFSVFWFVFQRRRQEHRCSEARSGFDLACSAQPLHPLPDREEPEPFILADDFCRVEAYPVVIDGNRH